ncbi:hypothetical protein PR202_gb26008 [Eleusine coracana subsp. coracana]|uniref:Uncharacterized protein n=1 Tax=Eleusine coracana subsp. coracana TaxID=191504 RepID=A0AAV5FQR6_ELECO|nr:hypothetical protein PR202_gb26008 [Eleusine coracana subsp. coracana]
MRTKPSVVKNGTAMRWLGLRRHERRGEGEDDEAESCNGTRGRANGRSDRGKARATLGEAKLLRRRDGGGAVNPNHGGGTAKLMVFACSILTCLSVPSRKC